MNRKKIVAGNWKMNNNLFEGKQLIADVLQKGLDLNERSEVVIAPPFTQLELAAGQLKNVPGFSLAAQNCHHEASGAYTGEVSSEMLQSVGVSYVILGHSERRLYFNETNDLLVKKVNQALSTNLKVIFCVGEPLEVREAGTHENH